MMIDRSRLDKHSTYSCRQAYTTSQKMCGKMNEIEADDMTKATQSRQQFIRIFEEIDRSCPEHKRYEKNRRAKIRKRLTDEIKKLEVSLHYVTGDIVLTES